MPAGRPILAAFDMLLSADVMFMIAEEARLPALLARSREAQAEVSTRLARQVLAALYELLRGFVAADAHRGALPVLERESSSHLCSGLIIVLMRLVFLLYTEDRGMMPGHPVYQQHYSLGGLFARLRADAVAWPDNMDQRFLELHDLTMTGLDQKAYFEPMGISQNAMARAIGAAPRAINEIVHARRSLTPASSDRP